MLECVKECNRSAWLNGYKRIVIMLLVTGEQLLKIWFYRTVTVLEGG